MISQHEEAISHVVVDQFEATDLGAPFKVILSGCVKVAQGPEGNILSYTIPDPDGLLRTVVLTRILHPRKLFGADIKFLRKAAGVMQKDMAKSIGLRAEHVCKYENNAVPISVGSEKLLRIFFFNSVAPHLKNKDEFSKLLSRFFEELTPVAVHDVEDELVFRFHRVPRMPRAANDEEEYQLEEPIALSS